MTRDEIKANTVLLELATDLLGPPANGNRWRCPFHQERTASFVVRSQRWDCFGECATGGDVFDLVQQIKKIGFPEAARFLAARLGARFARSRVGSAHTRPERKGELLRADVQVLDAPEKIVTLVAEQTKGLDRKLAISLTRSAADRLWNPQCPLAVRSLDYLRKQRGLNDSTIRSARLGLCPSDYWPINSSGCKVWTPRGITIPWIVRNRLVLIEIRRLTGDEWGRRNYHPKYVEVYRDSECFRAGSTIFGPSEIGRNQPLIVVEGVFDALLLGQELGELATVITLGSTANHPQDSIFQSLSHASSCYAAHDNDAPGDGAAAEWSRSARRIKPPGGFKDWCDARVKGGTDLAFWWRVVLNIDDQHGSAHDPTDGK